MAIYAADIQINVKNKGDLKRLENRFEKLAKSSVNLEKTLKKLGQRNVVQVDTKAALNAINQLETKIKGLSRTVSVDARTSGGAGRRSEGGMSGAAMPLVAAAMVNRGRGSTSSSDSRIDLLDKGDRIFENHIKNLSNEIRQQETIVDNYGETASRAWDKHSKAVELYNKHQQKTTKTLDELDKRVVDSKLNKFAKGFLPSTAAKNFEVFAKSYLRTNSEVADLLQKQNKAVVDKVAEEKVNKEIAEQNFKTQEGILERKKDVLRLSKDETENTIRNALMTDRERDLHKAINKHKTKGFEALRESYREQEKINEALAKGEQPAKRITDAFANAKQKIKENFQKVQELRAEISKPLPKTGLFGGQGLGGFIGGGFKSLGKGGMLSSLGKGALGASAMIPGFAPFGIGAAAGAVGKSGGAALAGGALGVAGAGVVTGGLALAGVANQAAKAQAEFMKMKVALEGVTPSFDEYTNALDHVSKLSDKYATSQVDTIKNFTKLQASASASGFTVDEVAEAYEGLQAGVRATGGNQEQLNGVMLAASQIFAKGKVAAEEIRGQISERLPGTMALFAQSMGISGKALDKLLQEGKVTMTDFLNFTRHMKKIHEKTALEMVKDSSNAGQRLSKQWDDLILNIGTITQPVGAALQSMLADVLEDINEVSEGFIKLLGLTKEAKFENQKTRREVLEEQIKSVDKTGKLTTPMAIQQILGNVGLSLQNLGASSGSQFSLNPVITQLQIDESQDLIGRGGLPGKSMGPGSLRPDEKRMQAMAREYKNLIALEAKQKQELNDDLKKDTKELSKEEQKRLANFEKFKKNNKIERDFLNDKFNLGTRQADLNKEIALMVQVHGKENEKAIRAELELRDNLKKKLEGEVLSRGKIIDKIEEYEDRIRELKNPINQLVTLTEAAGDSFQDSFKDVIKGTKSVGDAFVDMFNRIADAYLDMVAEMIANQAKQGIVKFIGSIISGSGGAPPLPGPLPPIPNVITQTGGNYNFATGGFVDRPTNALIGEASGEYVIPEHKMSESMSRYQAGVRGKAVIPGSSAAESGGVSGTEIVVSYTGPTLNFNGDDYVPRSAVPEIINSAAKRGARAGEAKVFNNLKNSRSHRARIGL